MSEHGKVLLLVGSAKRPRSTSESLGEYLLERLRARGSETDTLLIHRSLRSNQHGEALLAAIDRADILVLASPLYVDSLPYLVVRTLELIAKRRERVSEPGGKRFVAIVNSGFPEAMQNGTALAICRKFALESGLGWAGGLALGGGEAINGRPLSEVGRMARRVTRSLDLAAAALAEGKPVPDEAVTLMAKPLVPSWAYTLLGEISWRRRAKRYGVQKNLRDRPYQS